MRERFLTGKVFESIADAQAQLDAWVRTYNEDRPHQSIGHVPPIRRFELRAITAESPRPKPTVAECRPWSFDAGRGDTKGVTKRYCVV